MPLVSEKTKLSEIRKITQGSSLEVLGESRAVDTTPAKSSPTRRDNREQNRDSRATQRQTSITNRRVADKERQAINVAASRTRAREKETAKLRQSQTTPLINIFNENPLGFIVNQGQDFFQNTNAKGFTEFKQPKQTDFIQDNKLIDNDTTFKQSQPQQFLDIRGNKAIEFTQTNRAPINNENSRLLDLHQKDSFLDNYYGELKGSGQLGIRRQSGPMSFSLLKQPFIVRDIGNNWGVDTVNPDELGFFGAVGGIVRGGINIIDQLGGAVIGRQPSVFASRALADVGRLGSLLLSTKGIGFLEKQRVLKRQNSYLTEKDQKDFPNSKYLGSVRGPISGFYSSDLEGSTSNLIDIGTNLKKYNQLSLLSQPGIPSLQFSINKVSDALQLAQYAKNQLEFESITDNIGIVLNSIPKNIRDVFPVDSDKRKYNVTIESGLQLPNIDLLDAISPVASVVSSVVTTGVNFLKGLRGPSIGLNLTSPFKTPSLPSIPNPFKGFETGGGTGGVFGNPFQKLGGITSGIGNFVRGIGNAVSSIGSINLDKNPINSSKSKAYEFDRTVWSEVGKDKVNLIPYGKRTKDMFGNILDESDGEPTPALYNYKTENELDFIPFRFEDSEGNLIVFRAILSGITDTFTPDYNPERYVGRPDNVYVYQGTTREISFTVDIYPKSAEELPVLYKKMNYLAGLTYPEWSSANGGGLGMVAPFCKLTLGEMYTNTSGYISGLTYTVMDSSTWETVFAKLPKYIQASVSFVYIGDRLPSKDQKHYEAPWIPEVQYGSAGGRREAYDNDANKAFKGLLKGRKKVSLNSLTGQTSSTSAQNSRNALRSKKTYKTLSNRFGG